MASYDPLNQLTIGELDACSRLLKTDIVTAIHGATMHRWAGMGIVAFIIAKRSDPAAQLTTYRAMTPAELMNVLGYPSDDDDDDADGDGQTDAEPGEPTGWQPEPEPPAPDLPTPPGGRPVNPPGLDGLADKAMADPTGRTRG